MKRSLLHMVFFSSALIALIPTARATTTRSANSARFVDYVRMATEAAAADRHHDAIAWYRKAIAQNPSLEASLAQDLANQYTWAEIPDSAIYWYNVHLRYHAEDVASRIGIARALSWDDRHDEALAAYRAVLPDAGDHTDDVAVGIARVTSWKDHLETAEAMYDSVLHRNPDHLDARIGRAQVANWSGRHRSAAELYDGILDDHPDNTEARAGLAQAQYWMGRPDLALNTIGEPPPPRSFDALTRDINRAQAPAAAYGYAQNKDSDDIRRRTHTVRGGLSPDLMSRVFAQYLRGRIEGPARPEVKRNQLSLEGGYRFDETYAIHVNPGIQWNSFDRSALGPESFWKDDFNLFILDAYFTVTPRDWLRADFGIYRGALDNPDPIFRGIAITGFTAGLDWRFRQTMVTTSAIGFTDYTDGNSKFSLAQKLLWQPVYQPPVSFRTRIISETGVGYFSFAETLGHGYYDPFQYVTIYQQAGFDMHFSPRVRARLNARLSFEKENGDDWFTAGAIDGYATYALKPRLTLTAGYFNSNSRLSTRSGYQADGFYVSLDYLFPR